MSMDWRIPDVPEREPTEPPSVWIAAAALFIALIAGFILTFLNWKQGTSIVSARFFACALAVPVLIWGVFCGFLYLHSEDWNNRVAWWNFLRQDHFNDWRGWAQWNLSILDVVTLAPETELAERMLGLEGTPPANAGKILTLPRNGIDDILTQLVTPLAGTLGRFAGKRTIHIAIQSGNETHLAILRGVLQRLDIAHASIAMSRFEAKALPNLLDDWMANQKVRPGYGYRRQTMMPDLCLVLACQLNEHATPSPASEAAVALLFGSWHFLEDAKLKPKARLFRPIPTATDEIPDALKTLIAAEPTPLKRLRNLWLSNLAKRDGHVVRAIAKDSEPALTVLDLDQALGVSGPASSMLLQALAAQAVFNGQGPQLVGMPDADGLRLNLVGNEYAPVENAKEPEIDFWEGSISAGVGCLTCLLMLCAIELDAGPAWSLSVIGVAVFLLFVGMPAGAIFKRRRVTDEFYRRVNR
ncbi:hypothetical protein AWB76_01854 [Caballeronia temeraria]|uniref:Uncharacterized protein n=1 Tax=Caballeronia temeraria TaxID=1777137 RepID=A0A158A709_9BURK|nr:hypothetical protein [Caballeronia temeraria]SAK53426.1 hypothetical protein AWB76_01854 [Caballeronia temeraria]